MVSPWLKLSLQVLALCSCPVLVSGQLPPGAKRPYQPTIRTGEVPLGLLGRPLGEYLTIEGSRYEPKPAVMVDTSRTLLVDTVNGKKLPKPVQVHVRTVRVLPTEGRCVLKGYESGRMGGTPPAAFKAAEEAGKPIEPGTLVWGWQFYFVATSAVSPKGLKIIPGGER
jgi:hypothetical protein